MTKHKSTISCNAPPHEGLVVSYFGNSVAVEAQDGQVFPCHLHKNQALPVVGDRVSVDINPEGCVVSSILPRKSLLSRGDDRGKMKAIAANIDAIVIVMAPPPIFAEYLVDRYLVAAELLSIPAILVMNKVDLLDDTTKADANERLAVYKKIPYPVILSSIYIENGMDALSDILKDKAAVLVGPSGVGKSSIIRTLCGRDVETREVTAKGIGKHTTTGTRLYHLPEGGHLIDSPGVREFNLWPVSQEALLSGFKEFKPFLSGCRFRDCAHTVEPGCVVQLAVKEGKLSQTRYANYQELSKKRIVDSRSK